VACCCEGGDEPLGSCATELVVDKMDQHLASYSPIYHYIKGYKNIFFYILDMGCAMAQVVSHWPVTMEAREWNQCTNTVNY
jgi:hypothetical protein